MEYGIIFIFFIICLILSIVLIILSNLLSIRDKDLEKISPYECGFNPFEDARQKFDVRFYLVGILFIIFDLEVSFLFPWSITFSYLPSFAYINMIIFLFILTVGFFYEWYYGALDWE